MSARLFRSIKSIFIRFNKTIVLVVTVLVMIALGVKIVSASTVDNQYSAYINNFTTSNDGKVISGLAGGTIQSSTTNNNATGLVFTINLGINTSTVPNDTIENHWDNTIVTNDNTSFLVELCLSSTQCWLSPIPFVPIPPSDSSNNIVGGNNTIYSQTTSSNGPLSSNNYVDDETISYTGFTSNQDLFRYNPQTQADTSIPSLTLTPNSSLTATLWYCASGNGATAAAAYKKSNTTVATKADNTTTGAPTVFGDDLCDGASFFQIGAPLTITTPATAAAAQQQIATSAAAVASPSTVTSSAADNLPACGIVWGQSGTINGCAAQIAYGVYYLCAWIAGLFGELFDFFIGYSVSSASYSYPFVVTGWTLVRNISNIFFIIIMVWSGFSAVFDTSATSMKKVVPALIINAFLINFSLFFTRVVIDVSNIGARMFYSEMLVCKQTDLVNGVCPPAKAQTGLAGYWPLSEKIVSSFNPQNMFKASILNPPTTSTDGAQDIASQAANAVNTTEKARDAADYFAVVSLIGAALMIVIAIMFFKVSFLFLGRVVGLYICMIFSPFAFLSRSIPAFNGVERLRWSDWLKELSNYAMMAPIFIFFLYIIYTFLSSDFVQQIGVQALASAGFFATVLSIAIPMLIIFFLMQAAQKATESLSGNIGKAIQKFGEQATGLAVGAATGGASFIGSNTIGRAANKLSNNEGFRDWAANNGRIGRMALKSVDSVGKSTFDARNTTVGKGFSKQFGLNLDQKALGFAGLDTKSSKGGYKQTQEDKVKAAEEYKKLLVTKKSDDEIKAEYTSAQLKERDEYDKKMDSILYDRWVAKAKDEASKDGAAFDSTKYEKKDWRKYKENGKTKAAYEKAKDSYQKTEPPEIAVTAAEKNKMRTNVYADKKERESGGAFATQDYYNKQGNLVAKNGELMRNPNATEDLFAHQNDGISGIDPVKKKNEKAAKGNNPYQALKEMAKGAAAYGAAGAVIGSAVPVVGTIAGGTIMSVVGALKALTNYSGTTNKRIGGAARTEQKKPDKVIADALKDMGGDDEGGGGSTSGGSTGGGNAGGGSSSGQTVDGFAAGLGGNSGGTGTNTS